MARIEIIFTQEVIDRTREQRLKLAQGFNKGETVDDYRGPIFESALLVVSDGVAKVYPIGKDERYYFPLHTIGRIKEIVTCADI